MLVHTVAEATVQGDTYSHVAPEPKTATLTEVLAETVRHILWLSD